MGNELSFLSIDFHVRSMVIYVVLVKPLSLSRKALSFVLESKTKYNCLDYKFKLHLTSNNQHEYPPKELNHKKSSKGKYQRSRPANQRCAAYWQF